MASTAIIRSSIPIQLATMSVGLPSLREIASRGNPIASIGKKILPTDAIGMAPEAIGSPNAKQKKAPSLLGLRRTPMRCSSYAATGAGSGCGRAPLVKRSPSVLLRALRPPVSPAYVAPPSRPSPAQRGKEKCRLAAARTLRCPGSLTRSPPAARSTRCAPDRAWWSSWWWSPWCACRCDSRSLRGRPDRRARRLARPRRSAPWRATRRYRTRAWRCR